MESQHQMVREMVELLSEELARRNDRMDRQADEIQQLSFKLGQAHQEVGRLERQLASNSSLARAE
jgi:predicted nuclease with TOPRIM domain